MKIQNISIEYNTFYASVSIFNLLGQRVYFNGKLCNDHLDLNNLTPGLYIAVLRSEKSVSCLKFNKN